MSEPNVISLDAMLSDEPRGGRPRRENCLPLNGGALDVILRSFDLEVGLNVAEDSVQVRQRKEVSIEGVLGMRETPPVSLMYEGSTMDTPNPDRWTVFAPKQQSHLRELIAENFDQRSPDGQARKLPWRLGADRWKQALEAISMCRRFHPLDDWIEARRPPDSGLDPLDPAVSLANIWCPLGTDPVARSAVEWWWRCIFSTLLARHAQPGAAQKQVPVPVSPPNFGKTTAHKLLAPLAGYADVRLDGDSEGALRDVAQTMRRSTIVAADELAGLRRDRLDGAKQILSADRDVFVPKYVTDAQTVDRRCVVVGACNPQRRLPLDPGLQARLVLVDLPCQPDGPIEPELQPETVDRLWSAAIWHHDRQTPDWVRGFAGLDAPDLVAARSEAIWWHHMTPDDRKLLEQEART